MEWVSPLVSPHRRGGVYGSAVPAELRASNPHSPYKPAGAGGGSPSAGDNTSPHRSSLLLSHSAWLPVWLCQSTLTQRQAHPMLPSRPPSRKATKDSGNAAFNVKTDKTTSALRRTSAASRWLVGLPGCNYEKEFPLPSLKHHSNCDFSVIYSPLQEQIVTHHISP